MVSGFPILGGNVSLTVPSVSAGENYIVCCEYDLSLFRHIVRSVLTEDLTAVLGSSGDISPPFAIVGAHQ